MHLNNMYDKTQYMLDCLMATHLKHNNLKFFDKSAVLICLEITFNDAKKCKQRSKLCMNLLFWHVFVLVGLRNIVS